MKLDFFGGYSTVPMKMKRFAPVLLALLLLMILPAVAAAEEGISSAAGDVRPATPTDLPCPHEHRETTNYYYDSPSYMAVDEQIHKVAGSAVVETRCLDCGEILAIEEDVYAEEIRPHTFKNNVCALCGYRRRAEKATEAPATEAPAAGTETTIYAESGDAGVPGVTLTDADLQTLEDSGVATLVVRDGKSSGAAVALNVRRMRAQTWNAGMDLRLDLLEREDGSFFTGLWLTRDGKEQRMPDKAGVTLRFYQPQTPPLKVSLSPSDTDTLVETDSAWNDKGYWTVPYQAEGTYFPLPQ